MRSGTGPSSNPRTRLVAGIFVVVGIIGMIVALPGADAAPDPRLALSPTSGPPGTWVRATGTRFTPLTAGTLRFGSSSVVSFRTDSRGAFSAGFPVPSTASPGSTAIVAIAGSVSTNALFTVNTTAPPATNPSVLIGVSTPGGASDLAELDTFERDAGTRAGVVMYFQGWAYDEFDPRLASSVAARGAVPEITWEPWDYRGGLSQPSYGLERIIDGTHDAYITRWAQAAKSYGRPLLVRFAHEMNDRHYPWSEQVNGNRPGQYVAAWRHVVDTFRSIGATNVSWIWAPNVSYEGTTGLKDLYPGDAYVDWVAVDGYNGGSALPWGGWLTFSQIFDTTLTELRAITTTKPVMIGETASAEAGGSKATWIQDFFAQLRLRPEIRAFVWFNHNKEVDWRVQSSESARLAFANGAASLGS